MRRTDVVVISVAICTVGVAMWIGADAIHVPAIYGAGIAALSAVIAVIAMLWQKRETPPTDKPVIVARDYAKATTRPRVRVDFTWNEGEPKDKPFILYNSGEAEALRIIPQAISEHETTCGFEPINHLAPKGQERIKRVPQIDGLGPIFSKLPSMLEHIVHSRADNIRRSNPPPDTELVTEKLKYVVDVAARARVDDRLPLLIRYEDSRGAKLATEYEVVFYMFAHVQEINVQWIRDD